MDAKLTIENGEDALAIDLSQQDLATLTWLLRDSTQLSHIFSQALLLRHTPKEAGELVKWASHVYPYYDSADSEVIRARKMMRLYLTLQLPVKAAKEAEKIVYLLPDSEASYGLLAKVQFMGGKFDAVPKTLDKCPALLKEWRMQALVSAMTDLALDGPTPYPRRVRLLAIKLTAEDYWTRLAALEI